MCGPWYHYSLSPFMSLREILLTIELKSRLMTKTDELNEAIKRNSEVCTLHKMLMIQSVVMQLSSQLVFATHELDELKKEGVER